VFPEMQTLATGSATRFTVHRMAQSQEVHGDVVCSLP
jgi:hypothetical protein